MSDEVDGVVDAWQRERPDLDVDSMHIWSRIDRLAAILDGHRKRAFSSHSIESWEFDVLAALRRAGAPHRLSPGQLLRETHVTSGTMTNRVDRLVKRGAVTRESDPNDGRGVLVALTPEGLALVDAALTSLLDVEQELLGGWQEGERAQFADALRRLLLGSDA
ncbi:MarR family winged helix-turn-helix transcriptional regulator [Tessaracoccus flavescens]|uniref:MarR family transcriptional regulator n=1 Tax=Tessaracoccus flavescens TaxID=399497 RepID=A0A1Q2CZ52_9ACTN|nr:MarR family transcriptional regulator [Tessaracoccus flavescens]AQP51383.1 MarR family transcriptional regulator [Tessaracoccus flavescens]